MLILFYLVAQMDILKKTNVLFRVLEAGTAMSAAWKLFSKLNCVHSGLQ